jgi:hypothetical protein
VTRWLALAALATASACALEPDVGPLLAGSCSDTDTHPDRVVSFAAQIRPILDRPMAGCSCHMPLPGGPGMATQLSGLSLSSYASLREGGVNSGSQIVIAGQPCASILYQKVSDAPPFGSRMPLTGPPFLTSDELALIHDWIAEGAANH